MVNNVHDGIKILALKSFFEKRGTIIKLKVVLLLPKEGISGYLEEKNASTYILVASININPQKTKDNTQPATATSSKEPKKHHPYYLVFIELLHNT